MSEPYNQFVQECEANFIHVGPYGGRFYWNGPGVYASSFEEMIEIARATTVPLTWDSPIVYPEQPDEAWYNWAKAEGRSLHDDDEEDYDDE